MTEGAQAAPAKKGWPLWAKLGCGCLGMGPGYRIRVFGAGRICGSSAIEWWISGYWERV